MSQYSQISGATLSKIAQKQAQRPASTTLNGPAAPALECTAVCKRFGGVDAVRGLDLTLQRGQVLALLGPSGCGKTTALRLIAGFEQVESGVIAINGRTVGGGGTNVPPEKRRVGMVFQEGALFPHLTVQENVAYGLPKGNARASRVDEVLELVGLSALRDRMPHELSGGQQQRVALGRALAPKPEVLLLDEPFSNLDPKLREQVRRDVMEILRASRATAIFVTHDQEEALYVGDVIAVMNEGRVEQAGTPEGIFHSPATKFVANFVGMVDFLPAKKEGDTLVTEIGLADFPGDFPVDFPVDFPGDWPELEAPAHAAANGNGNGYLLRQLEVMVRPDCLECVPAEEGSGTVVEREFRGAFYLYRVRLESGESVRCLLSHTAEYPLGARVTVTLRDGHHLRPFLDGMMVTHSPNGHQAGH